MNKYTKFNNITYLIFELVSINCFKTTNKKSQSIDLS